ncbi:hypothetical protein Tco_0938293 [Tanacetum coccineum]|uniref:Uncharacterized protein n=1 Tax=Tanacetum coccineum TaxID=301880 RepID=A0ABQ5DJG5_9ASTR
MAEVEEAAVRGRSSIERGFLTTNGKGSGNSVKVKGPSMDDGLDVGNGGEASGSVTSNVGNSPSPTSNVPNLISFATKVKGNTSHKNVNFRPLFTSAGNGLDVHVPKELVSVMNERLNNIVYRFFLSKRVVYPVVENYVKNTWGKFVLVFSIWKAFGGNTRELGSFREETDKTTNLHQHLSRISTQKLETASQITRDAVTTHLKTASQDL